MPYLVTTKELIGPHPLDKWEIEKRHAVATLEEARRGLVDRLAWDDTIPDAAGDGPYYLDLREQALRLPEQGGTVGPLPDGSVIEVEEVTVAAMWCLAGYEYSAGSEAGDWPLSKIIAAYNATSPSQSGKS